MTELDLTTDQLTELETAYATSLAVTPNTANLLFREAHTGYAFTDEPVSEEQMRAVYDLVKWGPTLMNTQPLRIVLVRTPEARERLVTHMMGANQERTRTAPLVAILAADVDFHDELHQIFPINPNAHLMFADEAGRTEVARNNAYLQTGYFIVGVRAAGLAAGPMGGFDAEAVDREFFPDGRHRSVLVVNLGHPADDSYRPRQPRLTFDEVITTV